MKIEAGVAAFSPCGDRFVPEGYRIGCGMREQLGQLAQIEGVTGVPILLPVAGYEDPMKLKSLMSEYDLVVGTVCPDIYAKAYWKNGSLACRDAAVRREAARAIKESIDFCREVGGADVLLWFAHDGYDYTFEDDYHTRWYYLIEGLEEVVSYRSDVKVTVEYKTKEPRIHQYVSDVGKSLLICEKINRPNLGIVIDLGHSLFAGENPAESVSLVSDYHRLFHVHINDNYRGWDDDLLVGSVHFWETLEFFYLLDRVGYDGWFTIDIWPARVDGSKALQESADRIQHFMQLAKSLPYEEIKKLQAENMVMDTLALLRKTVTRV
jgi:sugar phosphate isomerase/epimerase